MIIFKNFNFIGCFSIEKPTIFLDDCKQSSNKIGGKEADSSILFRLVFYVI